METRKIGSLDVSVIGVGCNNFGWRIEFDATQSVIDAALDAGINFFDTADMYGGTRSEQFLGRALGSRRDRIVLATKFGLKVDEERKGGARPEYIRQACEDSLRRLATDRIDLYQLHTPDPEVPIADTLGALDELVQAGKVREIGCSNFTAAQLREAESAAPGKARFVSVQNENSMLHREPENDGVLAECQCQGLAFLPYFPLASGLLTGKYRKGQPPPEKTRIAELDRFAGLLSDPNLELVESLIRFAEARGRTILELAFAWLLARPAVASVIAGATSPTQVRTNSAANWVLTSAELKEVEGLLSQTA